MDVEKLDFFQEVRVKSDFSEEIYRDKIGVVLGISEEDGIIYGYSVHLNDLNFSVFLEINDLVPTGKIFKREDFY